MDAWRGHGYPTGTPSLGFLACLSTAASLGNFPLGGVKKGRTSPKAPHPGPRGSIAHFPLSPGLLCSLVQRVWPLSTTGPWERQVR